MLDDTLKLRIAHIIRIIIVNAFRLLDRSLDLCGTIDLVRIYSTPQQQNRSVRLS